jgi:hypothetical protein
MIEHLSQVLTANGICGADPNHPEDPLEEIDTLILRRLEPGHWRGSYDLIGGLVGIGVFFLERLPHRTASEGISLILNHLEEWAEESSCGITWRTLPELLIESQRRQHPAGYYNLGVAHGIPGVVQFLGESVASGVDVTKAQRLLEGSVQWMLGQQQPQQMLSRYGNWVAQSERPSVSRLAWCYGDLGIAGTLLHTARRVGREDWLGFAKTLLDLCLAWLPEHATEVGLCHGALGIAHIFNRAYQAEHDVRFKEAANQYYARGLSLLEQLEIDAHPSPRRLTGSDFSFSFLQGKIGVALALLSAVDRIEPQWDRRLMLSGCRRAAPLQN